MQKSQAQQPQSDAQNDDRELVMRAKEDDAAFEELYEKYFGRIYGYVMKRIGNHDDAEDIVSQTFIKVINGLPKFQPLRPGSFKTWLYQIATTTIIDHVRRMSYRKTSELNEEIAGDSGQDLHKEALKGENRDTVFQAIKQLPEKDQLLITLRYYSDLAIEEIAETFEMNVNSTSVALHRALKKFEKVYQKLAPEEAPAT